MFKFLRFVTLALLCFLLKNVYAQKLDFQFGNVTISDLEIRSYKLDPTADAVILADYGNASLIYSGERFEIELWRDTQVKILNKNGFDYANVEIPFSSSEKISNIQASTFNIENGKIVETKIPKKLIIIVQESKYNKTIKIAFPNIREGSIIQYRYRLNSPAIYKFFPWEFQSSIPIRYSQFSATYPNFFNYRAIVKGDSKLVSRTLVTNDTYFLNQPVSESIMKWGGSNIPAFREEPFITGINDHLIALEFELAGINIPNGSYQEAIPSYATLSKKLLERDDFGYVLKKTKFLKKKTLEIIKDAKTDIEKLMLIHQFVSNKIFFNGNEDYTASQSLKYVFHEERGNSAEINMILIAMLRYAGITVDPIILSTRSNGAPHPVIATIGKFNYVIAQAYINGKKYFIDATEPLLPYNILPFECLSRRGRIIHPSISEWVETGNDEKYLSNTIVNISINEEGDIEGKLMNSLKSYDAFKRRKIIKNESLEGYIDNIKDSYPNINFKNITIQNIDSIYNPLKESIAFNFKRGAQKTSIGLVFNPLIFNKDQTNPFSSEKRKYPIDYGCPTSYIQTINIVFPTDFKVVVKPSSQSIKLKDDAGGFIYNCIQNGNTLTIQTKFFIEKIHYNPEDYQMLREFYAQFIRKSSELIVIKKVSI